MLRAVALRHSLRERENKCEIQVALNGPINEVPLITTTTVSASHSGGKGVHFCCLMLVDQSIVQVEVDGKWIVANAVADVVGGG